MKRNFLFAGIAAFSIALAGCNKSRDCGCVPPPVPGGKTEWKMFSVGGGFIGSYKELPADQQHELTIFPSQRFGFVNKTTGETTTGVMEVIPDFSSIYGTKTKLIFNPRIPVMSNDFYVLFSNTPQELIFGDNMHDGYSITFKRK